MFIYIQDSELWSKPYACLQPITIPLFLMYMSGNIDTFFSHFFVILSISCMTSLYMLLYTSHNQQSKNILFVYIWMCFGFIMCIAWICIFANELIICLVILGQILNIPSYYLGLTVLAWGNSISDLFSNVAIAKRGLHDMAVVGCYGSTIFNVNIGLSLSLTYICFNNYPNPYILEYDDSIWVTILFICIAVLGSICLMLSFDFKLNPITGYFLILLYVMYTMIQTILAFTINE
jgi:sodium/potassium/calcium exchanger 6